jgi:lipoprotein NlpD
MPAESESVWVWPAAGRVLQAFEPGKTKGITLSGTLGDPVIAVADGKVIFSGQGPRGYGNLIIVKHPADLLSVYAHNRAVLVKEGASVVRGQRIAELGDTDSDRPKLHFEVRRQGRPVDPIQILPPR